MELVKQNAQIAPNLNKDERQFIEAKASKHPKDLTESEFKNFLLVLIGKAHVFCNTKPDEANIQLAMPDLIDTISKYFSTLTLKELELSFKLGLLGEFGEVYGLNNKTYLNFFKGLLGSQKRLEANRKQGAYTNALNAPKALTDEEKRAIMTKACFEAFDKVKKGETINDLGNAIYNFIDRNWKIPFDAKTKKQFMSDAKAALISSKLGKFANADDSVSAKIKKQIDDINAGNNESEIISEAKRMILNQYFKELILKEIELKTIIK